MTFNEAADYIGETPKFTKKHSLAHTRECLRRLGNPEKRFRTVHVADQNGEWLCHTQVEAPFSAADVCGDALYLMSEDKSRIQVLRFHS